jgi:predicted type IV restriction endonuclease
MTDTLQAAPSSKPTSPKWEQDARDSIKAAIRKFARPLQDLVQRDANEGDTRLLVTDFLCEGLGYDKYEDLTTEFAVRGEFADYGVRIDKQLVAFIEVKRAAQKLNVRHLRQVETYAVKEGLEWVILTNGQTWQAYHVFAATGQQVEVHLALEVDVLSDESPAKKVESLLYLHRSALKRDLISDLWKRKAATAPTAMADVLLSDAVVDAVRREIRRASKYNPEADEVARILRSEVIRPELLLK